MSRITRIARSLCADSPDREQLFNDWIKAISYDTQHPINPAYVEKLRKQFAETPMPELLQWIEEHKVYLANEKQHWELEKGWKAQEEKRNRLNLVTDEDEYKRTDDTFERAVCSNENPLFEKKGMPAYGNDIAGQDKGLKGYFGVHVGGGWLPILVRDQYCEDDYAYIYDIDTEPVYNSKKPFYIMEDFHIMDRTSTPNSHIIFSRYQVIPARLITLREVIPVSEIEPAPDLY